MTRLIELYDISQPSVHLNVGQPSSPVQRSTASLLTMTIGGSLQRPVTRAHRSRRRRLASLLLCGAVFVAGAVPFGTAAAASPNAVGMSAVLGADGKVGGYWVVLADGTVKAFGAAPATLGDMSGRLRGGPVVAMASTPSGKGYWLVAADGGIFAFGDAAFYGSMGGRPLARPIVSMAGTKSGRGYWLVAADGGIFAFGDAAFYGSMGGRSMNASVADMAVTPNGDGYYLLGADGGVFRFGAANVAFSRIVAGLEAASSYAAIAVTARGSGTRLIETDSQIFTSSNGNAPLAPVPVVPNSKIVDLVANPEANSTAGYYFLAADGGVFNVGLPFLGSAV
jgi:hypothetical protein